MAVAHVPMIYVVNSPKLAYLWSLMSEVKCVMRNQHSSHSPINKAEMPNGHKVFTQHRQFVHCKVLHEKKAIQVFERDVLIFRSIELFALRLSITLTLTSLSFFIPLLHPKSIWFYKYIKRAMFLAYTKFTVKIFGSRIWVGRGKTESSLENECSEVCVRTNQRTTYLLKHSAKVCNTFWYDGT